MNSVGDIYTNIRCLLNSSLTLSHSLQFFLQLLSHHLAELWFLHVCSSDAYSRACTCAQPLPDPSFPSSGRVHSGCRCSAICSGSAGGPSWPSLIHANSPYSMLLQTSPLWSAAEIMTPSPLPPNREHYNVNTAKMLWTNVPYHANSIW